MEKIQIPIDKQLYDLICLFWIDDNPDLMTPENVADEITSMVLSYLGREQEFGELDLVVSTAYDRYLSDMYADARKRNSEKNNEKSNN